MLPQGIELVFLVFPGRLLLFLPVKLLLPSNPATLLKLFELFLKVANFLLQQPQPM
jgi:hypothetical protein